jgi:4-amino-4-deoxy-L-arabinose transferase-like glycosyltransferase
MTIKLNNRTINISGRNVMYLLVIILFTLYLGLNLEYNTAFVDEAIYATVGEEVLRGIFWESALSWMGGSYLYPIISATINHHLGLAGIRLFSILCMLIAGLTTSKIARQIGGRETEIVALIIFLFTANTLNLGQLGTYDTLSIAFLSLGTYTAVSSRYQKGLKRHLLTILSAIFVACAVLSKYIAVLFIPAAILLILYKNKRLHILRTLVWVSVAYLIVGTYVYLNLESVYSFFSGTNFSEISSRGAIIKEIVTYLYLLIITTPFAIVYAFKKLNHEKKTLIAILFIAGLMPILYHLGSSNIRSSWKHFVFTNYFWVPPSAWLITKLFKNLKNQHLKNNRLNNLAQLSASVVFILVLLSIWINLGNHWRFQRSWPSANKSIEYLRTNRKPDDKIFAEASAVYKYHLFTGFEDPSSWSSTWWLSYNDQQGIDAMKQAIRDQYFDYIILNGYFTSYINNEIIWDVSQNYVPVLQDNYVVFGKYDHTTTIWKAKNNF